MSKTWFPITWDNIIRRVNDITDKKVSEIPAPTISLYRDVTLVQLETLITNSQIEFGKHYKVADKDWLLTGIANNKLVDFAGQGITIMNGDTLPTGVEPSVLFIDTGIITDDIEVTPLEITNKEGYSFHYLEFGFVGTEYQEGWELKLTLYQVEMIHPNIAAQDINSNSRYFGHCYTKSLGGQRAPLDPYKLYYSNNVGAGVRAILKFEKSRL